MFTDFNKIYVAFRKKDHKSTPTLIYRDKASQALYLTTQDLPSSRSLHLAAQKTMLQEEYLKDHEDYMSILYVTSKQIRTVLK